ncbi:hypothetical protein FACS1894200_02770 [Spirochaetia bacterium]|nr:hypothetical protein FACS1894200_02770 [Spirochaetia bacterium]
MGRAYTMPCFKYRIKQKQPIAVVKIKASAMRQKRFVFGNVQHGAGIRSDDCDNGSIDHGENDPKALAITNISYSE